MSDTPRTDEAQSDQGHDCGWSHEERMMVDADFARQLERELAAAQAEAARLRAVADGLARALEACKGDTLDHPQESAVDRLIAAEAALAAYQAGPPAKEAAETS